MRMVLTTLAVLALTGPVPAAAEMLSAPAMPQCDPATLAGDEAGYEGYGYTQTGEGFAFYERTRIDGDRWEFILDHCPTRDRLTVALDGPGVAEQVQRINDVMGPIRAAIESPQPYSLRDLRDLARQSGAEAALSRPETSSCVCRDIGY